MAWTLKAIARRVWSIELDVCDRSEQMDARITILMEAGYSDHIRGLHEGLHERDVGETYGPVHKGPNFKEPAVKGSACPQQRHVKARAGRYA